MSIPAEHLPADDSVIGSILDLDSELLDSSALNPDLSSEPPLGTDARAGDASAGAPKPDASTEGAGVAAKKVDTTDAGKKTAGDDTGEIEDEDLDLDDEERAIKAAPEEHRPTLEKTRKAANFMGHFHQGTASVDVLKQASPARYAEFAGKVVRDRLSDAKRFVTDDLDDATYGAVYAEMVKANPLWIVEKLTGRKDLDLAGLKAVIDGDGANESTQLKSVFEAMPDLDKLVDADGDEVSLDTFASDYPALADWLKAVKLAGTDQLPKTFTSKLSAAEERAQKAETELEALKAGGKPDAQTSKAGENGDVAGKAVELSPEAITARQAVDKANFDYVERHALDKDGLNLAVSDAERTAAPEVADLKDTFAESWIYGNIKKGIPPFSTGLIKHFKDSGNEKFLEAARQVKYYADRGETDNAVAEAGKIHKYIQAYAKARADLPYFKSLDRLIAMHSKSASRTQRVERVSPGGGSQTLSPGSPAEETDEDLLNTYGV